MKIQNFTPKFTKLFINNQWVDSSSKETINVVNPGTGKKICEVQAAGKQDVDTAVKHAQAALKSKQWKDIDEVDRGQLLFKLADLIEKNNDEIAWVESLNCGTPYEQTRTFDIPSAIRCFRYYAGWCGKLTGTTIPMHKDYLCYTKREPVGICGQIIPWNYPIHMLSWKWGPALASGCVTIFKPSEKTPLTALMIADLAKQAGFPPGVVQVLNGGGNVGQAMVEHPKIDKIAFTGSTKTGFKIQNGSANKNLKRVSLELGGKSPNIICHDADLEVATDAAKDGLFVVSGQCCSACSNIYVHEDIYEKFLEILLQKVKTIKVGDQFDSQTQQGPQVDKIQFDSIMNYIDIAKKEGCRLITGGNAIQKDGYYIEPTIFADVTEDHTIAREEVFGPVMSVLKFKDYDEVVERANSTNYGLAAGIVTKDISLFQNIANNIKAGTVYINCYNIDDVNATFGGYKDSGFGKENGEEAFSSYLQTKTYILKKDQMKGLNL